MARLKSKLFSESESQTKQIGFKVSEDLKNRLDSINKRLADLSPGMSLDHAVHLRNFLSELVTNAEKEIESLESSKSGKKDQAGLNVSAVDEMGVDDIENT